MPNWVFNKVEISGTEQAIAEFKELALGFDSPFLREGEKDQFTFHAFITPPADRVEEYHTTNGFVDGVKSGDTEYNWYRFNSREWGTKWDACNPEVESSNNTINISFDTAWSPPIPVFSAMTEQFPNLDFYFRWQEEQDWGGEASGSNGEFSIDREWDIPNSHEEYLDIGSDCTACVGWYSDEPEKWYDDCPGKQEKIMENNMKKQTITIVGTDVNVGEVVESLLSNDSINDETLYRVNSTEVFGVEQSWNRLTGAELIIETQGGIDNKKLDGMREQFPAVDIEVN